MRVKSILKSSPLANVSHFEALELDEIPEKEEVTVKSLS